MWFGCCFSEPAAHARNSRDSVAGPGACDEVVEGTTTSLPSTSGSVLHAETGFKRLSAILDSVQLGHDDDRRPNKSTAGRIALDSPAAASSQPATAGAATAAPRYLQPFLPLAGNTALAAGKTGSAPGLSPPHHSASQQPASALSPPTPRLPRSASQNGAASSAPNNSRSPSQAGNGHVMVPYYASGYNSASISRMQSLLFGAGHGGGEHSPHSCNGSVMSSDTWGNLSVLSGNLSILSDRQNTMASDVLAKFLADVNQYDNPGTVHLLQQDLRNLSIIGRGGCGIVYQAEWRGAHVAVKLAVSDGAEKLQDNVMEAITGRFLAHPQVVHTYAAVLVPVDHALMLLDDPDLQLDPDALGADPVSELEVQQLLAGADEPESAWADSGYEVEGARRTGRTSRPSAEAEDGEGPGAATVTGCFGSVAIATGGSVDMGNGGMDPLHEMWLSQQLVDRRAEASSIPLVPDAPAQHGRHPPWQPEMHQGTEQHPSASAQQQHRGWGREVPNPPALGGHHQRWPPSPVKEESGSTEVSPVEPQGIAARSLQWPPEQHHDSCPALPAEPHHGSLPEALLGARGLLRGAAVIVASEVAPAGSGGEEPGAAVGTSAPSAQPPAAGAIGEPAVQQCQPSSPPAAAVPLLHLLPLTLSPSKSLSRLQRSITAADAAADDARRSSESPTVLGQLSSEDIEGRTALMGLQSGAHASHSSKDNSIGLSRPVRRSLLSRASEDLDTLQQYAATLGAGSAPSGLKATGTSVAQGTGSELLDRADVDAGSQGAGPGLPALPALKMRRSDEARPLLPPPPLQLQSRMRHSDGQLPQPQPQTQLQGNSSPQTQGQVQEQQDAQAPTYLLAPAHHELPRSQLQLDVQLQPYLQVQPASQAVSESRPASPQDCQAQSQPLHTLQGRNSNSSVVTVSDSLRTMPGATGGKANSRPNSLRTAFGLSDDRVPSFRAVLQADGLRATGFQHASVGPGSGAEAAAGEDGMLGSGAGSSDICLSPKPATPDGDKEVIFTPKAVIGRSLGSYPGGGGAPLQAHRVKSLPHSLGRAEETPLLPPPGVRMQTENGAGGWEAWASAHAMASASLRQRSPTSPTVETAPSRPQPAAPAPYTPPVRPYMPHPLELPGRDAGVRVSPPTPRNGRTSSSAGSTATAPFSPTPGNTEHVDVLNSLQMRRKLLTQRSDASQLAQFFDPSAPTSPSHTSAAAQWGSAGSNTRCFNRWDSGATTSPFSGTLDGVALPHSQLSDDTPLLMQPQQSVSQDLLARIEASAPEGVSALHGAAEPQQGQRQEQAAHERQQQQQGPSYHSAPQQQLPAHVTPAHSASQQLHPSSAHLATSLSAPGKQRSQMLLVQGTEKRNGSPDGATESWQAARHQGQAVAQQQQQQEGALRLGRGKSAKEQHEQVSLQQQNTESQPHLQHTEQQQQLQHPQQHLQRPGRQSRPGQAKPGPLDPPTRSDHRRRNSAGSVDFSFGNSFTGKASYMFDEALRLLNLKPGQFVTCLVMEYCDRGSLAGAIKRGLFSPSERWGRGTALRALIRTAKEVAQGLSYLHSVNITHGDLKPGNVLLKSSRLDRRGFTVRLADFGFCKMGGQEDTRGMSTLAYSAPESLDGHRGPASDVWSFGVLLYEMVVGRQPLLSLHWGALLAALAAGDVTQYFEWPATTHPVLRRLGVACMSVDPGKRPSAHVISKVMVKLEDSLKLPSSAHGGHSFSHSHVYGHSHHQHSGAVSMGGMAHAHRGSTPQLGTVVSGQHAGPRPLAHRLSHSGAANSGMAPVLPQQQQQQQLLDVASPQADAPGTMTAVR